MSNYYTITVVLRHAIIAGSEEEAKEVVNEQYRDLAKDGTLSDFHVYEWEDAISEGIESDA